MVWADCTHKTYKDHTVGRDARDRLIWRCTNCLKTEVWSASWGYNGNVECRDCGLAGIDAVACSKACHEALIEKGIVAAEAPKPKPRATSKQDAQVQRRRRVAIEALKALTPEDRVEVLDAVWRDEEK